MCASLGCLWMTQSGTSGKRLAQGCSQPGMQQWLQRHLRFAQGLFVRAAGPLRHASCLAGCVCGAFVVLY